jgi:hypothetical protein
MYFVQEGRGKRKEGRVRKKKGERGGEKERG